MKNILIAIVVLCALMSMAGVKYQTTCPNTKCGKDVICDGVLKSETAKIYTNTATADRVESVKTVTRTVTTATCPACKATFDVTRVQFERDEIIRVAPIKGTVVEAAVTPK